MRLAVEAEEVGMAERALIRQVGAGAVYASLPIETFQEGKLYVANCPSLRVASQGKTEAVAEKALSEAIDLFFEELKQMGTLEEVLLESGWTRVRQARKMYMVPPRVHLSQLPVGPVPVPA